MDPSLERFWKPGSGAPTALSDARIRREVGEWIASRHDWRVFATLTFRSEITGPEAGAHFSSFCRRLARERVRGHVAVAWGTERGARGVNHYHALFAPLTDADHGLHLVDFDGLWPYGNEKIEYCAGDGAAYYVAKHGCWDLNVACTRPARCRRRRGCLHAAGALQSPSEFSGMWT